MPSELGKILRKIIKDLDTLVEHAAADARRIKEDYEKLKEKEDGKG